MSCRSILWFLWLSVCCCGCHGAPQGKNRLVNLKNSTQIARRFLQDVETLGTNLSAYTDEARWASYTDLRPANRKAAILATTLNKQYMLAVSRNACRIREPDLPHDIARQIMLLRRNAQPNAQNDTAMLESLIANMTEIYGKGEACKTSNKTDCMALEPDLENIMAKSRDYDELLWAWKGWRDAVGPPVRGLFREMVDLLNLGASQHHWGDYGHFMRSVYEMGNDLIPTLKKLWAAVKPLYQELHAYVRFQLKKKYPQISTDGPVPAHLFGNMWSQDWGAIYDIVQPFPKVSPLDVTPNLIKQQYTAEKMFKLAQSFFVSIGLDPMPSSFWNKSMLRKPGNKSVVCHASAWAFLNDDVRIKMCTRLNQDDLITVHHEMGHVEYYLAYKHLPYAYRNGANPGFHEAIGDAIALSVETPKHLKCIGLLYKLPKGDEGTINFLMIQALRRIAPLPFAYLVDQWRWRVLAGKVTSSNYNSVWWKLRTRYQGVAAPVPRNESDFDPGAKFHIVANEPYISYFVSLILQFQFHRTLCHLAKQTGPLHECSIYKSKDAGQKFKEMLAAGLSRPWPQTLYRFTGEREMTADALLDYFAPLRKWLFAYRIQHKYPLGWKKLKTQATPAAEGVKKTLSGAGEGTSANASPSSVQNNASSKGVSFHASKLSNEGINLTKPDLLTALRAMQPNSDSPRKRAKEGELDAKSVIQGSKPMFVPNKIKDQLDLG